MYMYAWYAAVGAPCGWNKLVYSRPGDCYTATVPFSLQCSSWARHHIHIHMLVIPGIHFFTCPNPAISYAIQTLSTSLTSMQCMCRWILHIATHIPLRAGIIEDTVITYDLSMPFICMVSTATVTICSYHKVDTCRQGTSGDHGSHKAPTSPYAAGKVLPSCS